MRTCIRLLGGIAAATALLIAAYAVAAAIGSRVAVNASWRAPVAGGVTVWVEDNGVHTSIVMPKRAAGVDWTRVFPAGAIRDPRYGGWGHVAVGWGERGFFVGTPTWWDVRPGTIVRAVAGSPDTVLHVEHVAPPVAGRAVRAVVLRPSEYRRLAAFVRASLGEGEPVRGYDGHDAFYPGRGRYDWRTTCNVWTGRAFAFAGVRIGRWTPTAGGVMRWFPR
ncbi:hypothetical protein ASG29_08970 [Sphingomonas sp. Leaf412]|uniref:DUF2459 domain-containing protein n=1 Tax=Sphingomonas sp. Leaf412 TaxID=1736370 RepID=UPI0006F45FAB|nr:DUF2459 domain-containing protein [Sphingomonas sp. Leaf412]KQT31984.1 hypothetical protein ASG29_08970 [Sphingomonas sp. Leaf412]